MIREVLIAGAVSLIWAAPAWADCMEEIADAEQRLAEVRTTSDGEGTMVGTDQGQVRLEGRDGGVEPRENWFGSPSTVANAAEQLDNARRLADSGDEPGCMYHVDFARQILSGLQP